MILCFKMKQIPNLVPEYCYSIFMQYITTIRSSCLQMFFELGVLKNFAMFTGKHLCWSLFSWSCRSKEHHRWFLLYYIFIGNLMTYINRKLTTWFQCNTLCLYHVSISSFIISLSVLLKLLKHIKRIFFENIMNVKQNMFSIKKNSSMIWGPQRGS